MGLRDFYKKGEWNAICYVCGFQRKSGEMKLRWDGVYVCKEDWEIRQPQDFVRGVPDEQPLPWSQPEVPPGFGTLPIFTPTANVVSGTPTLFLNNQNYQGTYALSSSTRTNLITDSSADTSNGNWTLGPNMSRIGTTTGPDGNNTAVIYQCNVIGNSFISLGVTLVGGTTYTFSGWFKVIKTPSQGTFLNFNNQFFQNVAGSALSGAWQRASNTFVAPDSNPHAVYFVTDFGVGAQIAVFGAQLEVGSNATAYIPTTNGTVSAGADYSITLPQGVVTLNSTPVAGGTLSWSGTWIDGASVSTTFTKYPLYTTNGYTTTYQIYGTK